MDPDDDVCLCFHVSRRKLENYLRVNQPRKASQLSQCGGAGTGCGWCIPVLEKLFCHQTSAAEKALELPNSSNHASGRARHLAKKRPTQSDS